MQYKEKIMQYFVCYIGSDGKIHNDTVNINSSINSEKDFDKRIKDMGDKILLVERII